MTKGRAYALQSSPDTLSADLWRSHAAGKQLLILINDILDFAKIESGNVELHHETFHIPAMVHAIVATLQPLLAANT